MENFTPVSGLIGGLLIGLAAALLLLLNGRIGGVSGIVGGLLAPKSPDAGWRAAFVAGLLLGALAYFGLDGMDVSEKEGMRQLALRGGPYSNTERQALLNYCEADVVALRRLLERMEPHLDVPRALLRAAT